MANAPDRWNWVQGAMVPGPLTAEDEEKQRRKKAEKDKKLKVWVHPLLHSVTSGS